MLEILDCRCATDEVNAATLCFDLIFGLGFVMSTTRIPVILHLGDVVIGVSSLQKVHMFLATFGSHPPSHIFLKDFNEILLMCSQICVLLTAASSIGRFISLPILLALMVYPLARNIGCAFLLVCGLLGVRKIEYDDQ